MQSSRFKSGGIYVQLMLRGFDNPRIEVGVK
jgi:hypothetical protein